jgi:hypothetical protein
MLEKVLKFDTNFGKSGEVMRTIPHRNEKVVIKVISTLASINLENKDF